MKELVDMINKSKADLYSKFSIGTFNEQLKKLPSKLGLNTSGNKKLGQDIKVYVKNRQFQDLNPVTKNQQLVSILSKIGSLSTHSQKKDSRLNESREVFRIKPTNRYTSSKLPELREVRNSSWRSKLSQNLSPMGSHPPTLSHLEPYLFPGPSMNSAKSPSQSYFFKFPAPDRRSEPLVSLQGARSRLGESNTFIYQQSRLENNGL